MNDELNELASAIQQLPTEHRLRLEPLANRAVEARRRKRHSPGTRRGIEEAWGVRHYGGLGQQIRCVKRLQTFACQRPLKFSMAAWNPVSWGP